ncbi:PREDICTED: protein NETWORKED 4B-like isoform X2 [Camelina sativa]|uniref:Protein NETWORKED 4B-like isoform X2 n=1 Tax=Camelina sativa TaxID=90675 RepID=A0ABM0XU31_CAMSA|nr:PREDICTED: protein NETWORKED 4B-like isoform X2 [Camelina sativa]XP_010491050.1 PREDICTED: protein NETWORKED 4B-like isoform X2 [Camelina sativa]
MEDIDDSNSFVEISSEPNGSSTPVTPKSDTIPVAAAFNFDHGSSDISPNHDSDDDSSYSELDSETEAFYSSLNHHLVSPGAMDDLVAAEKKHMSYEELMKKYVQSEEELKTTSLRLQESEQEIEKLKAEAEKRDYDVLLSENLFAALEIEIESRDKAIETEKSRVLEMQRQVVDLETKLSDSSFKFDNLVKELEVSRECLYVSEAEISKLRAMLCVCQQSFSTEKTKLQSDIAGLLANQAFFEGRVKELQTRSEVLENQIWHSDAEKMDMQRKEVELQGEINALKTELASRGEHIEALNKDADEHKLRYDMLVAEKDEVCAEVDNLKAVMRTRDIQIQQMEEQLSQLRFKLVSESRIGKNTVEEELRLRATVKQLEKQAELQRNVKNTVEENLRATVKELGKQADQLQRNVKNTVEELRAKVKELEKQAELQRNAISEAKEEKREAIRQLCFTLDHYKSGYRQILRFLSGNNNKEQQTTMVV